MNEIIEKENIIIENLIYEIRGVQVMLDSDIAKLYQVETKRINEAVKNNPDKFPERFSFRITEEEFNSLKSKFSTSKGGSRKGHTVFTEQGLYMLATILKSKVATNVSIAIMDTFVKMRHYINYNKELLDILKKIDKNIIIVSKNINETLKNKYASQYKNIAFINNNSFHDRFIIIDKKILYSCGASFKDLGKKCFAISKFDDKDYLIRLLKTIHL